MTAKRIYGLLGEKLGHSLSPQIHAKLGDYDYGLHEVAPENLESFIKTADFAGLNVTIPYKKAVIPFCARLTDRARAIGSVNTLIREDDGTLTGDNTDYAGFRAMVETSGLSVAGKKCLVLGSGGASLTVIAVLKDLGAGEVIVVSRSGADNYGNLEKHADAALIVNATPVGMSPKCDASPLESLDGFPKLEGVLDLIYNPAQTNLLAMARECGLVAVNGLRMLVVQAAVAAEAWKVGSASDAQCASIEREMKLAAANICLIGMPGAGKSTVGRRVAETLKRPFVDMDAEIVERIGMPIPQFFAQKGEAAFRDLETEVLASFADRHGLVIATGGGAVMRPQNRRLLQRNGFICWLDRPLEDLPTAGRPVSQSRGVEAIFAEREPVYRALADKVVKCTSVRSAARQILGESAGHIEK